MITEHFESVLSKKLLDTSEFSIPGECNFNITWYLLTKAREEITVVVETRWACIPIVFIVFSVCRHCCPGIIFNVFNVQIQTSAHLCEPFLTFKPFPLTKNYSLSHIGTQGLIHNYKVNNMHHIPT